MGTIKRILVPLIGEGRGMEAFAAARRWGKVFEARVSVVYFKYDPVTLFEPLGDYPVVTTQAVDEIAAQQDATVAEWRRRFEEWTAQAQIEQGEADRRPCAQWAVEIGRDRDRLTHWGRLNDLVIIPVPGETGSGRLMVMAETTLFEAGRPVLFVPEGAQSRSDTAVVAWDGSREAARAVSAALPLLGRYAHIALFTRRELRKPEAQPEDMLGYLADHGIDARLDEGSPGGHDLGEQLLERCGALDAGLLVMGAYSHSRFRQSIFGGVTRHVLEHATVPVLMCH